MITTMSSMVLEIPSTTTIATTSRFGTILYSLQGMVLIQLDENSDFSLKTHYFAQQQEDMISIQNILYIYALDTVAIGAHSRHEMW